MIRRSIVVPAKPIDEYINTYNQDRDLGKNLDGIRKIILDSIPDYTDEILVISDNSLFKEAAFNWMDPTIVEAIFQHLRNKRKLDSFKQYIQKLCDSPSEEIGDIPEKYGLCKDGGSLRFRKRFNSFTNRKKPVHVQSIKRNKRKPLQKRQSRKK